MKKLLIAAIVFFAVSQVEAQVTFRPGIRAGVNFSHFTQGDNYYRNNNYYDPNSGQYVYYNDDVEFNSKTDFYVGLYGALRLTKYYTLQPEVNYSRQGSKVKSKFFDGNNYRTQESQFDVSYISVGVINKFTFNEKFNIHVGPTIDVLTDRSNNMPQNGPVMYYNDYSYYYDSDSDIDLAFTLGLGYNFTKNLAIEARVKKGIVPVLDLSDDNHTNVVFSAGLSYTFDVK